MGADHPIAWYHTYDGGRAWYSAMGHTSESYSKPLFLAHLWGGVIYAMGARGSSQGRDRATALTRYVISSGAWVSLGSASGMLAAGSCPASRRRPYAGLFRRR